MKVTNPPSHDLQQVEKTTSNREKAPVQADKFKTEPAKDLSSASTVELSENAQLMRTASEAVKTHSVDNSEKIASLKERIANGTYQIDSATVAEKLIEEHLFSDFGKNQL